LRHNLHTHTTFSDGGREPEEVCRAAIAGGLSHIGISDHYCSYKLPEDSTVTMETMAEYVEAIHALQAEHRGEIQVLAGLEIVFSLVQTDFSLLFRRMFEGDPVLALDFILFEYVNEKSWNGLDIRELVKIRPKFPMPIGLAHTDIDRNFKGVVGAEELARVLAGEAVFVELCPSPRNARPISAGEGAGGEEGVLPYYRVDSRFNRIFFEEARKRGVLFSIGTDAHGPKDDVAGVDDAVDFIRENGLEENLVLSLFSA
jgi:hypothetical protein